MRPGLPLQGRESGRHRPPVVAPRRALSSTRPEGAYIVRSPRLPRLASCPVLRPTAQQLPSERPPSRAGDRPVTPDLENADELARFYVVANIHQHVSYIASLLCYHIDFVIRFKLSSQRYIVFQVHTNSTSGGDNWDILRRCADPGRASAACNCRGSAARQAAPFGTNVTSSSSAINAGHPAQIEMRSSNADNRTWRWRP